MTRSRKTVRITLITVFTVLGALAISFGVAALVLARRQAAKQRELRRLLLATLDVLHRNNIPYVLSWGTLLGAVREGRIIPHDDDADITLFGEAARQRAARALVRAAIPNARVYVTHNDILRIGSGKAFVDLYVADLRSTSPTQKEKMWVQRDNAGTPEQDVSTLPEDAVETREQRTIHGVRAFVPRRPHQVLRRMYGDSYMTPQHTKSAADARSGSLLYRMRMVLHKIGLFV